MKIQADMSVRVVALTNLEAICERASGMAHKFWVEKVTPNRVIVGYSNPNEYGTPWPIFAHYPAFPSGDKETPFVAIGYCLRVTGREDENDGSDQSFEQLKDMETLWRDAQSGEWATEYEVLSAQMPGWQVTSTWDKDGCIQTWHCAGSDFKRAADAREYAVKMMREARETERNVKKS